jgi:hypothetical protein
MSLTLVFLLAVQVPPTAPTPVVVTGTEQAKPKKPKALCKMMEITGSHTRHRVCQDANGYFDPGPGISNTGAAGLRATHQNGVSGKPMGTVPSG